MKWEMNKNFSAADTKAMLSLKRKREAEGKSITLLYKDREVDLEKLEREHKRHKGSLDSPSSMSS